MARVEMALHFRDHVDPTKYQDMCDRIHVDERCFFLSQEKEGIPSFWMRTTQNGA